MHQVVVADTVETVASTVKVMPETEIPVCAKHVQLNKKYMTSTNAHLANARHSIFLIQIVIVQRLTIRTVIVRHILVI